MADQEFTLYRELTGLDESRLAFLPVNPERYNRLIERRGVYGELRRSIICPCVRVETGAPRTECPSCNGLGRFYPHTDDARLSVCALLTNRKPSGSDREPGHMVDVEARISFPVPLIPGRGDMFIPTPDDQGNGSGEVHIVDETFYSGARVDGAAAVAEIAARDGLTDLTPVATQTRTYTLRYPADVPGCALSIERLAWWSGTEAVIGKDGIDYVLDGNTIRFFVGRGPSAGGDTVSVRYRAPAAYVVEHNPAFFRASAGRTLPFSAGVKRLDKVGVRDLL